MSELTVLDYRMDQLRPRVQHGAEMLDHTRPGWFRNIDTGRLDMKLPCRCIVGQLFGDEDQQTDFLSMMYEVFELSRFNLNATVGLAGYLGLDATYDEDRHKEIFELADCYTPYVNTIIAAERHLSYVDTIIAAERHLSYVALEHLWVEEIKHRYEEAS